MRVLEDQWSPDYNWKPREAFTKRSDCKHFPYIKWEILIGPIRDDFEIWFSLADGELPIRTRGTFQARVIYHSGKVRVYTRREVFLAPRRNNRLIVDFPVYLKRLKTGEFQRGFKVQYSIDFDPVGRVPHIGNTVPGSLLDDMERLWSEGKYYDVTLRINDGEAEIKAHKVILASCSNMFAAMFSSGMRESIEGVVDIKDVEPDVMRAIVRFAYTGKFDQVFETGPDDALFLIGLFIASDRYLMAELHAPLVDQLYRILTDQNAMDILEVGLKFSITFLVDKARERLKRRTRHETCPST